MLRIQRIRDDFLNFPVDPIEYHMQHGDVRMSRWPRVVLVRNKMWLVQTRVIY